jgi:hypothetical protein
MASQHPELPSRTVQGGAAEEHGSGALAAAPNGGSVRVLAGLVHGMA